MKKLILFNLSLFMLTACSTDEPDTKIKASIVGKWEIEESLHGTNNQNLDACEQQNTFEFTKDGLVFEHDYYEGDGGECGETSGTGEYSATEDLLTFTFGSTSFDEPILELTKDKLVLLVDKRYNGPAEDEKYTVTYKRIK